jgi:hypothetical protein
MDEINTPPAPTTVVLDLKMRSGMAVFVKKPPETTPITNIRHFTIIVPVNSIPTSGKDPPHLAKSPSSIYKQPTKKFYIQVFSIYFVTIFFFSLVLFLLTHILIPAFVFVLFHVWPFFCFVFGRRGRRHVRGGAHGVSGLWPSPPDISRDIADLSYFILSLILYHVMFGDARRFKLPVGYHACTHRIT